MKLKYIKMDNKIYVGGGTEKFDGNLVSVSVCLSDLPSEHIQTGKNGKKYINLNVQKKKENNYQHYPMCKKITGIECVTQMQYQFRIVNSITLVFFRRGYLSF